MLAWMNAEALEKTLRGRQVVYWSRSRQALWRKGETSGNTQDHAYAHSIVMVTRCYCGEATRRRCLPYGTPDLLFLCASEKPAGS